jgi:hypothetical protein
MPRIRLMKPNSTRFMEFNVLTMGTVNTTSPPPPGGAPLFLIFKSNFGEVSCNAKEEINVGNNTPRMASTDRSTLSLVTPRSVSCTSFLANKHNGNTPSMKYPMPRPNPQSCVVLPPTMMPGLYSKVVPVELISMCAPLVSLSIKRKKLASKGRRPGRSSRSRIRSNRKGRPLRVEQTRFGWKRTTTTRRTRRRRWWWKRRRRSFSVSSFWLWRTWKWGWWWQDDVFLQPPIVFSVRTIHRCRRIRLWCSCWIDRHGAGCV